MNRVGLCPTCSLIGGYNNERIHGEKSETRSKAGHEKK